MNDQKQALDNFSNQMLNSALNGINEAVAKKQEEINWWAKKAQALAVKYKACLYCQSNQDFVPELLECEACQQKNKEFLKGISSKKEARNA